MHFDCDVFALDRLSHPTRGAWIEISVTLKISIASVSRTLPGVRGLKLLAAVVRDIGFLCRTLPGVRGLKLKRKSVVFEAEIGRTLPGVRGLKFLVVRPFGQIEYVAPYPGCVD